MRMWVRGQLSTGPMLFPPSQCQFTPFFGTKPQIPGTYPLVPRYLPYILVSRNESALPHGVDSRQMTTHGLEILVLEIRYFFGKNLNQYLQAFESAMFPPTRFSFFILIQTTGPRRPDSGWIEHSASLMSSYQVASGPTRTPMVATITPLPPVFLECITYVRLRSFFWGVDGMLSRKIS